MKTIRLALLILLLAGNSLYAQNTHFIFHFDAGIGKVHSQLSINDGQSVFYTWKSAWSAGAQYRLSLGVKWSLSSGLSLNNMRVREKQFLPASAPNIQIHYTFINQYLLSLPLRLDRQIKHWRIGGGPQAYFNVSGSAILEENRIDGNNQVIDTQNSTRSNSLAFKLGGVLWCQRELTQQLGVYLKYSRSLWNSFNQEFAEQPNIQQVNLGIAFQL